MPWIKPSRRGGLKKQQQSDGSPGDSSGPVYGDHGETYHNRPGIAAGRDTGGSGDGTPAPDPQPAPEIGTPDLPGVDPDASGNGDHTINDTLYGGTIGGSGWPGLWMFAFQARRSARR